MNDVQHTPGPWRVKHRGDGRVSVETCDDLWNICVLAEGDDDAAGAIEADAALIASAPDLFAACKAAEDALQALWEALPDDATPEQEAQFAALATLRAALARASTKPNP